MSKLNIVTPLVSVLFLINCQHEIEKGRQIKKWRPVFCGRGSRGSFDDRHCCCFVIVDYEPCVDFLPLEHQANKSVAKKMRNLIVYGGYFDVKSKKEKYVHSPSVRTSIRIFSTSCLGVYKLFVVLSLCHSLRVKEKNIHGFFLYFIVKSSLAVSKSK